MKTLQYLFFGCMATLLMAADCSNKDSEFYNDVFISVPNLVAIDNADGVHSLGEPIIVRCSFSKVVNEIGQNTALDVFKTSGGARSFTFSYLLERDSDGVWLPVNIDATDVVRDNGYTESYGEFVLAKSEFDTELQDYEYGGGFIPQESGNYRLRFTYNNAPSPTIVLVSDSFNNNLFVNINSTCADLDQNGYYYFTVN